VLEFVASLKLNLIKEGTALPLGVVGGKGKRTKVVQNSQGGVSPEGEDKAHRGSPRHGFKKKGEKGKRIGGDGCRRK